MPEIDQNGIECQEFEALMSDALDGVLSGTALMRFDAHRAHCSNCATMFNEAMTGLSLLKALPAVDPPSGLVQRIVEATTGQHHIATAEATAAARGWRDRLREIAAPWLRPVRATLMQPRFAMSFAMAFFSISLILNLAGVKASDLRHVDLRPSAMVRGYYETTGRLVKYYENIRFVYEIETRVRELKRATEPSEQTPAKEPDRKDEHKSGTPDQNRYRNYSWEESQPVMANYLGRGPSDHPAIEVRRNS
ncbi:MAG TPA: zf-HC2 domain-containing protein [Terriglobales bacterium]|nr:zf-HC2 domain-containing protein [Terriglobales bacterium]